MPNQNQDNEFVVCSICGCHVKKKNLAKHRQKIHGTSFGEGRPIQLTDSNVKKWTREYGSTIDEIRNLDSIGKRARVKRPAKPTLYQPLPEIYLKSDAEREAEERARALVAKWKYEDESQNEAKRLRTERERCAEKERLLLLQK